jgi:hypothetical protein
VLSIPGFDAETSLYATSHRYCGASSSARVSEIIQPAQGRDWGCYWGCIAGCTFVPWPFSWWCYAQCDRACCVPTTSCSDDPASPDPRCQICTRFNCDGTASTWHTC